MSGTRGAWRAKKPSGHGADFGLLRFQRNALLCPTVGGHAYVADNLHAVQHGSSRRAGSSPKPPYSRQKRAKTIEKPLKNERRVV